jgi:hypothetical protein
MKTIILNEHNLSVIIGIIPELDVPKIEKVIHHSCDSFNCQASANRKVYLTDYKTIFDKLVNNELYRNNIKSLYMADTITVIVDGIRHII